LQRKKLRGKQVAGAKVLLEVASEIFNRNKGWGPMVRGWSEFVQKLFSSRRGLAKRKQFKSSQEERNKKFCSFCSCGTLMFVSKVVLFCFFVLVEVAVGGSVS
jgi:hypothetical protein